MPTHSQNDHPRGGPSLRRLSALLLAVSLSATSAFASMDSADIEVVTVRGEVRITSRGEEHGAKAGTTLDLPSTVRTGRDGATDLRQGDTTIGVGPGTQLEFPAPGMPDSPVERIVQPLGNAFYNVGPRGNRRLRVETPYLVAVVKGTQFNVAAEPDSGTISLYEGSLEILAPDIGATVQLNAGEIAMRHRGDDAIRVISMRDRAVPATKPKDTDVADPDADIAAAPEVLGNEGGLLPDVSGPITPIDPVEGTVVLEADVDASGLAGAQAGIDADFDLGAGTVDAAADVGLDAGVVDVDSGLDAGADLGAGTVDAGVDSGLDAGPISTDAGVDLGADLTGSDAGIDVGLEVLDTGIDIGLGGDASLIDIDTTPATEDSGGLLDGIRRILGD
jgi:hypothetical protein